MRKIGTGSTYNKEEIRTKKNKLLKRHSCWSWIMTKQKS